MAHETLMSSGTDEVLLERRAHHLGSVEVGPDLDGLEIASHRPRRVQFVVDTRTGEFFEADDFLGNEKDPIRRGELFQARFENHKSLREGGTLFVCPLCPSGPQPLLLSGKKNQHFFFKHKGGSEECDVKLNKLSHEEIRRIKYNGHQRGPLHEKLKEDIAKYLRAENGLQGDVFIEKRVTDYSVSKEWRQPDVRASVNGTMYAFEIQVSTDFLDVVVGRNVFYARLGIRLIWVFPKFSGNLEDHRFAESDIFYKNNSNAFVFDLEAAERSSDEGRLFLKCRYRRFVVADGKLFPEWGIELVTLDQLRTSEDGEATYFHDTSRDKAWCESILAAEVQLVKAQKAEKRRLAAKEAKRLAREEFMKFDSTNPADQALRFLRNLYSGNGERWNGYDPIAALTEDEHINRLNIKLAFDGGRVGVVEKAIVDPSKAVFVRHIFHSPNVRIAVNRLVVNGTPVLQWCMQLESETEFRIMAAHLFRKGYRLTPDDKAYLIGQYDNASIGAGDSERLFRWGFVSFLSKIGMERVNDLVQIEHALFAILSIKLGRVIGSGFRNLKEVVNTMFHNHSGHGSVFLHALYKYNQIDRLAQEDAKGTIGKKISAFVAFKPKQILLYDSMFSAVFPDLGNRQSWG